MVHGSWFRVEGKWGWWILKWKGGDAKKVKTAKRSQCFGVLCDMDGLEGK
jgi:hypothetical protein